MRWAPTVDAATYAAITPPNSREENGVLADTDITTLVAVDDLDEASDFYETKLHLAKVRQEPGWIQYRTGTSQLIVYTSQHAGSNKATTAVWTVEDVADAVDDLKAAGISTFKPGMPSCRTCAAATTRSPPTCL
jgi:hypothetical protein